MDEDFRKTPKHSIFDDSSATTPVSVPKEKVSIYEDLPPHPLAKAEPKQTEVTQVADHEIAQIAQPQEQTYTEPTPDQIPQSHIEKRTMLPNISKKTIVISAIITLFLLIIISIGIYIHNKNSDVMLESTNTSKASSPVAIPVYHPTNLPAGYTYNNDQKTVSSNVFSMSVTGPKKELFYITQQTPPINGDYTPFNKQLSDIKIFKASIGTVTTGSKKSTYIVSIATTSNTWVIINSPDTASQNIIQPVIDSLSL